MACQARVVYAEITNNEGNVKMPRPLSTIAREIQEDYAAKGKPVHYAAKPYVDAMRTMTNITDSFYADDGISVVTYALHNLSVWRGDKAREIKTELKAILADA